jgi:hypothetical protein
MFKYEDLMIQVSPKFITRQEHERKVKKWINIEYI